MRLGEWDARGKTTTEILHVVQNDGLRVRRNSLGLGSSMGDGLSGVWEIGPHS